MMNQATKRKREGDLPSSSNDKFQSPQKVEIPIENLASAVCDGTIPTKVVVSVYGLAIDPLFSSHVLPPLVVIFIFSNNYYNGSRFILIHTKGKESNGATIFTRLSSISDYKRSHESIITYRY